MLYSAAKEEEELKQKIKILGGRQSAKAGSKLKSLYKGLPEGMDTKTYDEFRASGTDDTPDRWLERKDLKPGTMTEWNTDMKITDKAKPVSGGGGGMSAAKAGAALGALGSIFEGLDQAFGEGDIISMGSGHQMQGGYNPEMYIGQGLGY